MKDTAIIQSQKIIIEALKRGQSMLGEHESKKLLSYFDIPICREVIAFSVDQAVDEAVKIGFPVALKVSGANLFHKTEMSGVALNLKGESDVRKEAQRLIEMPGCEGLLVQEMVEGNREIVCGLTTDRHFGPLVMFGLGGIYTEIFQDVSFRMAPVSLLDVKEMIQEIQGKKILEKFRGQSSANFEMLYHILMTVGEIAIRLKDVLEIDINPIKIRPDGDAVAVDALVILRDGLKIDSSLKTVEGEYDLNSVSIKKGGITPFFEPSSVVIIGASSNVGKPGNTVIKNILANGYSGKLYLVNPKGGEIFGMPVYSSIAALPDEIDLSIIICLHKKLPRLCESV